MKLKRRHLWDGVEGHNTDTEQTSQGLASTTVPYDTGMWLVWEVFMFTDTPNKPGDSLPASWHATIIGNDLDFSSGICVNLEPNRDPRKKVPIHMSHASPGDSGRLYHQAPGEVIRSNYSTECSLKGQIVDEGSNALLAPDIIREDAFSGKTSFAYDGNPWISNMPVSESIMRHRTGQASQQAIPLLGWISDDSQRALNLDKQFTGEGLGSRASSQEAGTVFRNSAQPILAKIRYAMNHGLYWKAEQILIYGYAFAKESTVYAITDDRGISKTFQIKGDMNRAFDIEINIVDEFENDVLKKQALNEKLAIVSQNPELLKHIDVEEMLRAIFEVDKLQSSKFIIPGVDADAGQIAEMENAGFIAGTYVSPQPGQNHRKHKVSHHALFIQLQGFEPEELVANGMNADTVTLLQQHEEETDFMIQQEQQGSGSAPAGQRNESEGEAQGNQIAALSGAAAGGGTGFNGPQ